MGGHSDPKTDAEGLAFISGFKGIAEAHSHAEYHTFEPVSYTTQVVAGTVYKSKVHVGGGHYIHIKVFQPLPHTGEACSIMEHSAGHALGDHY